jgi:hypothetical protein
MHSRRDGVEPLAGRLRPHRRGSTSAPPGCRKHRHARHPVLRLPKDGHTRPLVVRQAHRLRRQCDGWVRVPVQLTPIAQVLRTLPKF